MITNFLIFFSGAMIGLITMALAAAAGDADRCSECIRTTEELERLRNDVYGPETADVCTWDGVVGSIEVYEPDDCPWR